MIEGSVYLITGGASGLGRAAAERLLLEGAHLTILDLQRPVEDSNFRICEARVLFLQVDVTSEKDVLNAMDATKRKFGKLNGVINCAGVFSTAPIYDFKAHEPHSMQIFMKIIDVNLCGTFNVVRLAIALLAENEPNSDGERGIIINTSSVLGHRGSPQCLAYCASKAGVIGMTYSLAKELKTHGIRVLDIAPGITDNEFSDLARQSIGHLFSLPSKEKPSDFGQLVKCIIENQMFNGTSVKLSAT